MAANQVNTKQAKQEQEPKKTPSPEPASANQFSDADRKLCLDIESLCPGFIRDVQPIPMGGTLNPDWVAFLKSPIDPSSPNEPWNARLQGYVTAEDCAEVYKAYLADKARREGKKPEQTATNADGRPSLSDLASPRTQGASSIPASPERVYRMADYERLKREAADPKNVARFPELKQQLLEYQRAFAEGRVRA
jgi:hypothetical protein